MIYIFIYFSCTHFLIFLNKETVKVNLYTTITVVQVIVVTIVTLVTVTIQHQSSPR